MTNPNNGAFEVHNLKCRNRKCDSIEATQIKIPNKHSRVYRCNKCGHVWTVRVGGNIEL